MNPDAERLLAEVLDESAPADFRAGLLDLTLRHARRRRHLRQLNQGLLVVALVAAAFVLTWKPRGHVEVRMEPQQPGLNIIASTPLNPAIIVASSLATVREIHSSPAMMAIITTDPGRHYFRLLDDEQLMAMTEGKPTVLVREGPHEEELLVVNDGAAVLAVEAFGN